MKNYKFFFFNLFGKKYNEVIRMRLVVDLKGKYFLYDKIIVFYI